MFHRIKKSMRETSTCPISPYVIPGIKGSFKFKNYSRDKYQMIIDKCLEYFDLTWEEICSKSRKQPLVWCRQAIYYLAHKYTSLTKSELAHRFNQDHTTAIHHIKAIQNFMEIDPQVRNMIQSIEINIL